MNHRLIVLLMVCPLSAAAGYEKLRLQVSLYAILRKPAARELKASDYREYHLNTEGAYAIEGDPHHMDTKQIMIEHADLNVAKEEATITCRLYSTQKTVSAHFKFGMADVLKPCPQDETQYVTFSLTSPSDDVG